MAVKGSSGNRRKEKAGVREDLLRRKKTEEALRESAEKYKFLVDNSEDFIFVISKTGRIAFANRKALATIGYTPKEMVGKSIISFLVKSSVKKAFYALSQEFLGHPQREFDIDIKTKLGETRTLELSIGSAYVHEKGRLIGILISAHDITERKRMEKALQDSEARFRGFFELSADLVVIADIDGYFRQVNSAWSKLMGYSEKEILGRPFLDFVHPDDKEKTIQVIAEKLKRGDTILSFENRYVRKDRSVIWLEWTSRPQVEKGITFAIARDITERKKAEEAILRANAFNTTVIENAPFGIMTIRKDGSVDYVNPAILEISGDSKANFKSMNVFKLLPYAQIGLSKKINECFSGKPFFIGPVEYVSHFSKKMSVRNFTGIPMRDEAGKVEKVMLFIDDLTQIKQAEKKLRESEERFRAIFEGATDGILVADAKTKRFVFANPSLCELTGRSANELLKLSIGDIHPAKDLLYVMAQVARQIKGEITLASNIPVLRKDKQVVFCDVNSKVMKIGEQDYLVGFFRDITERKKADEDLRKRAEEMEKFNQMTVGRELRMVELKKRIEELENELKSKGIKHENEAKQ